MEQNKWVLKTHGNNDVEIIIPPPKGGGLLKTLKDV